MPLISTISSLSDQAFGGFNSGSPPVNTVAPVISGTVQARQTVTTNLGTWVGTPSDITYAYQWKSNSGNISGAISSSYTILSSLTGTVLTSNITATNYRGTSVPASSTGVTIVPNVPLTPSTPVASVTNYNQVTLTFTPNDDGGASTTYYAVSTPAGLNGSSVTGTIQISVPVSSMTTYYTWKITATNSVGSSAATASSNSVKSEPAIGSILAGYAGGPDFGKYVGDGYVVNPFTTFNTNWTSANSGISGLSHTSYTTAWYFPSITEMQTYRIASGIWDSSGPSWSSTSGSGGHYAMDNSGGSSIYPNGTGLFAMAMASLVA